ncbi:AAEL010542-PA, partial [Aedes aegypti]
SSTKIAKYAWTTDKTNQRRFNDIITTAVNPDNEQNGSKHCSCFLSLCRSLGSHKCILAGTVIYSRLLKNKKKRRI